MSEGPHHAAVRDRGERGAGLLSAVLAVACVAGVLGLAVNVTLGLWTRSTVDAVAYDVARDIATAPGADRSEAAREGVRDGLAMLGRYGERVRLDVVRADDELVVLRVRAPGVDLLPSMVGGGPAVGAIDRELVVRSESP